MFSRLSGKNKKPGVDLASAERVFESVHITADRVGTALCVSIADEHVTEREAGIIYDESVAQLDDRCTGIVLDFSNVEMLASAGIGTLVRLHKRMKERKGQVALCGLSSELKELLKLTRMDKLLTVCDDKPSAVAAVVS